MHAPVIAAAGLWLLQIDLVPVLSNSQRDAVVAFFGHAFVTENGCIGVSENVA